MNEKQKHVLIAVAAIIALMLLYPPFQMFTGTRIHRTGYDWLFDLPQRAVVDIGTLGLQWVGVLIVGGIIFFVLKDGEK